MNILFLGLPTITSFSERSLFTDLLREFINQGHFVCAVTSIERRKESNTQLTFENGNKLLVVKTLNTQKTNIIEKGISTVFIPFQYIKAIKQYLSNERFDLVLYPTPPITLLNVVKFVKKRDNARSYLMLKDIFPQNAVDLGMMSKKGVKGVLYRYFRAKEKKLYAISDKIGCMSQANVDYVLRHNPEISPSKVEILPNSIAIKDEVVISAKDKESIRLQYNIPSDKKVFVYGGNLGKPQGISFVIDCLRAEKDNQDVFFVIVGDGTEYKKLEDFVNREKPKNVLLMKRLPKSEYENMISACDVGLIFLDRRFTIPNFPSRLLSYMQLGMPVLACTDKNTDIGKVITEGQFGVWCESNSVDGFVNAVDKIVSGAVHFSPEKEKEKLRTDYNVANSAKIICKEFGR